MARHFTITSNEQGFGPGDLMQRAKPLVLRLMRENRQTTINLLLNCEIVRQDLTSRDTETIIAHFRTRTTINLEGNDDEEEFRIFLETMEQGIFNFNQRGSNCVFQRVVNLEINVADYFPTGGSSYILLTEKLNGKKAILNMKNQDNQCFKWSLTRALNPVKKDPQRITKLLMEQSENPNWDKILTGLRKTIKFLSMYLVLTVEFTLSE